MYRSAYDMYKYLFTGTGTQKGKCKLCHTPLQERRQGAHLSSLGHESVDGYTSKSVRRQTIRLPFQPQNVTGLWPVPNYTAW